MNKGIIILIGILCATSTSLVAGRDLATIVEDTVIIEVGGSKIIIIVNSAEDLKKLEKFDINQMIVDLNINVVADSLKLEELVLADSLGSVYQQEELVYYGDTSSDHTPLGFNNSKEFDDIEPEEDRYGFNDEGESKKDFKRTTSSFNLELGMNNWLQKGGFPDTNGETYAVKPWGSWYVALSHTNHTKISGPLSLDWGGNVSWYNWKLENRNVRIVKDTDQTTFIEDTSIEGQKSKLVGNYLNFNLVPILSFGNKSEAKVSDGYFSTKYDRKGLRMGLGGYAGYRINSWTKFVYKEDGDDKKDKQRGNYFMNNFRYGIRGVIGYKAMDLFINYDLNSVFASGRGPELNAISFGFIF